VNDFIWEPQDLVWQQEAACLGLFNKTGVDLFFPPDNPGGPKAGKGITGEKERLKKAKALCNSCIVKEKCLEYALENDCSGLWGGTTDTERRRRKKMT
jgi:WhiB family redox-sensing transcriptional regulator